MPVQQQNQCHCNALGLKDRDDRIADFGEGVEMVASGIPLSRYGLFSTADRQEAQARVGEVFCPHGLEIMPGQRLDVVHNHLPLGDISVNYLSYGGAVTIQPVPFETFYLLQLPVAGHADIELQSTYFAATPERASLTNPTDRLAMRWSADCGKIIVRIDARAMQRYASALLDRDVGQDIRFSGAVEAMGAGGRLLRLIRFLADEMQAGECLPGPLVRQQIEQMIVCCLLESQPHSHERHLPGAAGIAPRHVRRAEDFIEAHAHEPIGIDDISRVAGVSVRTLHKGFRDFRDTSPMEFLRSVRMERAHRDLLEAGPGICVTEIATRWGFFQFGRFAGRYRDRYGEPPSATLRRSVARRH